MRHLLALWVALFGVIALVACNDGEDTPPGGTATPQLTDTPTLELKIIDQNVLHGLLDEDPAAEPSDRFPERVELLADALAEAQPDIVFLQEVVQPEPGDEYPNGREIWLGALGPAYTAIFGDAGGRPIGEGVLGQLTITRLPVVSSENHGISALRSIHRVTLDTEIGPLHVYNAHLEGTDEEAPQFAVDEIKVVLAFIEATRSGGPVVLAGDFNAEPDDPSIQRLLAAGYIDVLAEAGDATCGAPGDPGCTNSTIPLGDNPERLADRRIDYLFVRPGDDVSVEVRDAALFHDEPIDLGDGHTLWLSDHIGVQATLVLR